MGLSKDTSEAVEVPEIWFAPTPLSPTSSVTTQLISHKKGLSTTLKPLISYKSSTNFHPDIFSMSASTVLFCV